MRSSVITKRCVWNKTFPLGHFMLHFTTCIMFLREMTTKASNEGEYLDYVQNFEIEITG